MGGPARGPSPYPSLVRRARLLAVAVSAVLGVIAGVATGFVVDGNTVTSDPLGVGVPLVNQPCQPKQSLLVVGWGGAQAAVAAAVSSVPDGTARYLDTRESCRTAWNRAGHTASRYVVYQGPYPTHEACQQRLTGGVQGHLVTRLTAGSTEPVQCLCYFPFTKMPVLRPNADTTTTDTIFIRALQDLLTHMGRNPPDHVTGVYDPQTQTAIKEFQQQHHGFANGDVNTPTWQDLQKQGCRLYKS